jgi:Protein of unknown function (DUF1549)/Protein of unknown function (DUF1553)
MLFIRLAVVTVLICCAEKARAGDVSETRQQALVLAGLIDEKLAAQRGETTEPAPIADDSVFVRRVYLDLAGHIPGIDEARDFLDDPAPDKRLRLVDRLLARPEYAIHFSRVWRAAFLPTTVRVGQKHLIRPFEKWLRNRLQENAGFDRIVRGMVLSEHVERDTASPEAFDRVLDGKPENLAASTARLFLGIKLECAQCHNHPFARWTRQQFWEFACYFGSNVKHPVSGERLIARTPVGSSPRVIQGEPGRVALGRWLTSAENPWFARSAVNRVWRHFLGVGLVEPVDDITTVGNGAYSELLDDVAKQFASRGYDLRFLIQTITATRAYQQESAANSQFSAPFAYMEVRALSPEQLFDSLCMATGRPLRGSKANRFGPGSGRGLPVEFEILFAADGQSAEASTSILQALYLMNGNFMTEVMGGQTSDVVDVLAKAQSLDDPQRIEELFLNVLSRKPSAQETARLVKYVAGRDRKEALADVLWALLNSGEFAFNH